MKVDLEWRYSSTQSLTSALDGGGSSASPLDCFTRRERAPGTHWIGGWMGPRAVLDAMVNRKIPNPRREWNPRTPIVQAVTQRYTDWAIAALHLSKGKGKVVAVLLTEHHPWRRIGGVDMPFHVFLTSALDGGEWSASRPGQFTPTLSGRENDDTVFAPQRLKQITKYTKVEPFNSKTLDA
jgi:hypothetical protein